MASLSAYGMEEDPEEIPQYFQVSVNVLEASKLAWTHPQLVTSYVLVELGKQRHRTSVRKETEPRFCDYYVFELYTTLKNLQKKIIRWTVFESRNFGPARVVGQAFMELSTIWQQPHHQIFHKWLQLTTPTDVIEGPRGFLKVDIFILPKNETNCISAFHCATIEGNLLRKTIADQQMASFVVIVYRAYCLGQSKFRLPDSSYKKNLKPPNSFICITYCGLMGKTTVQRKNFNPIYNQRISFVEMFPNASPVMKIDIRNDAKNSKMLGSFSLRLDRISHSGENGFLPTFGPSIVHLYSQSDDTHDMDNDGPYYRGCLLFSLRTLLTSIEAFRSVNVEPVPGSSLDSIWQIEDFYLFCPIFEVSMLNQKLCGKDCSVAISMASVPLTSSADKEFQDMMSEIKRKRSYYSGEMPVRRAKDSDGYLSLGPEFPALQLILRYPDFRFRMFRNNMIRLIANKLEMVLQYTEGRLDTVDCQSFQELYSYLENVEEDTVASIQKFLDTSDKFLQQIGVHDQNTENYKDLDIKQSVLQNIELQKICCDFKQAHTKNFEQFSEKMSRVSENKEIKKKYVKQKLARLKEILNSITKIVFTCEEGWPDLVIWLLCKGSPVAYQRISASDVVYSSISEQKGSKCATFNTILLKPIKCFKHPAKCSCVSAKMEIFCWFGLFKQRLSIKSLLPESYKRSISTIGFVNYVTVDSLLLECRAYIYRAKLTSGARFNALADCFVRVNIFKKFNETLVKFKTLTPIFNQTLRVQSKEYYSPDRLNKDPPIALIEIWDNDTDDEPELIGRVKVAPVVTTDDIKYTPKLKWHPLHKNDANMGQILMSLQILMIRQLEDVSAIQPLPQHLIPDSTTYKLDVYWWGLREVNAENPYAELSIEDVIVKSDVVNQKTPNVNFSICRLSQIFEAPLKEDYCPPLIIRLYENGAFGRSMFLGTNVLKNPNKFITDWIRKDEREALLKTASIRSLLNGKDLPGKPLDNCNTHGEESLSFEKELRSNYYNSQEQNQFGFWNREFQNKQAAHHITTGSNCKSNDKPPVDCYIFYNERKDFSNDWWTRFFCLTKGYTDELHEMDLLKIYDSELELLQEFSNFKDWCHTLKLYCGKKTGNPEKDSKMHCGYLKSGIMIYKWPPPENLEAVTPNGINLSQGYFRDYPNNEPIEFLLRVYVVQGINLMGERFQGKCDPYVIVQCGQAQIGQRKKYVPNTTNPVFANVYELEGRLPEDYQVTLSVYDYDATPPDELIGSTTIDVEDRIYSKHRATCGLPTKYATSGPNRWRDCEKPSAILEQLCAVNHLPPPIFLNNSSVLFNGVEYYSQEKLSSASEKVENICLSLLNKWHEMPVCGYALVPEHVETRALYHPAKPDSDQGKIQLWLDIFPLKPNLKIPAPTHIQSRPPEKFDLRVTVWNLSELPTNSQKRFFGCKASEVSVMGWIGNPGNEKITDTRKIFKGAAENFEESMVFPIVYHHAERKIMVYNEQDIASTGPNLVPPVLFVHIVDANSSCRDDVISSLALDLSRIPRDLSSASYTNIPSSHSKRVNLFNVGVLRGWWPLEYIDENGRDIRAGKIDLELSVMPYNKVVVMPLETTRLHQSSSASEPVQKNSVSLLERCRLLKFVDSDAMRFTALVAVLVLAVCGILYVLLWSSNQSVHFKHKKFKLQKYTADPINDPLWPFII